MDEKIRLIQAEFGLKGFAVVVLLFKEIYGGQGYYMTWDEDRLLLFMSENGVAGGDKNLIQEIVAACIKRGIFSTELFQEYQILTSSGIQKRYFNAVARREKVNAIKEYLLVSVDIKKINVDRNAINVDRNRINVDRNTQSREEKSREENIENTTYSLSPDGNAPPEESTDKTPYKEIMEMYHDICASYPRLRNLSDKRKKAIKTRLKTYSVDDIREAFTKAEASDFLKGRNNRNWSADFDWMICEGGGNNLAKILEGKYDNRADSRSGQGQAATAKYDAGLFDRLAGESRGGAYGP